MEEIDFKHLAYLWHGGQWSPLYAFASMGTVTEGLSGEIRACVRIAEAGKTDLADDELDDLKMFLAWAEAEEEKKFPE